MLGLFLALKKNGWGECPIPGSMLRLPSPYPNTRKWLPAAETKKTPPSYTPLPDWVRRCYFGRCGKMSSSASFLSTVNANRQTESFFIWKKGPKVAHIYFLKGFSNCFYQCKKVFFKPYSTCVSKEKLFWLGSIWFSALSFLSHFQISDIRKIFWAHWTTWTNSSGSDPQGIFIFRFSKVYLTMAFCLWKHTYLTCPWWF
jgi:hypothetical protein